MVQDFKGNMILNMCITFGGVAGCRSFGQPANTWKEIMLAEFDLFHIFRWVDKNLYVRRKGANTNMKTIVKRSLHLGVKTNEKKYSKFSKQQKFIGFIWNSNKNTVTLPPGKLQDRIAQI
jgi:hypothetical protein